MQYFLKRATYLLVYETNDIVVGFIKILVHEITYSLHYAYLLCNSTLLSVAFYRLINKPE